MILGMGLDIVDVDAFEEQLSDQASTFVEGTFTLNERHEASSRPGRRPARHLAVRFAAKEAFIKAWSMTLVGQPPILPNVDFREIEVTTDAWRRPQLLLHGAVSRACSPLEPFRSHLSLSHDGSCAAAVVVLEKMPQTDGNRSPLAPLPSDIY